MLALAVCRRGRQLAIPHRRPRPARVGLAGPAGPGEAVTSAKRPCEVPLVPRTPSEGGTSLLVCASRSLAPAWTAPQQCVRSAEPRVDRAVSSARGRGAGCGGARGGAAGQLAQKHRCPCWAGSSPGTEQASLRTPAPAETGSGAFGLTCVPGPRPRPLPGPSRDVGLGQLGPELLGQFLTLVFGGQAGPARLTGVPFAFSRPEKPLGLLAPSGGQQRSKFTRSCLAHLTSGF